MADFWHHFKEMRFPNRCRRCGTDLPAGKSGWGTKDSRGKWMFLCDKCHETEEQAMKVETLEDTFDEMPEWLEANVEMVDEVEHVVKVVEPRKKTYLERRAEEAPWRF